MTRKDLEACSDAELHDLFIRAWERMGEIYHSDMRTYRRLFKQQQYAAAELKSRSSDGYRILLPALDHEDCWVRYGTAMACYSEATDEAMAALTAIGRTLPFHTLGYFVRDFLEHRARGIPFPMPRDFRWPTAREETNPALREVLDRAKEIGDHHAAQRRSKR